MTDKKRVNRSKLEDIANETGDLYIMERLFWTMFDNLSVKNQEKIIKEAERALKEQRGF